ncbi:hypothetical protein DFP73DRAFT_575749 [Morchella snyderi]|nr:hypothetical protein DFP73DRAFT_575749 [Morchella snyderi]
MQQADIDLDSVQSIGKHCDLPSCHRLDFLPFKCESCSKTYCLDHRTETAHKCAHEGRWAALRAPKPSSTTPSTPKPRSLLEGPCAHPSCKTTINTVRDPGVNCVTCRRTYCLAHRLQDSHNCDSIKPASTGSSSTAAGHDMAKAALSRFKAWTASKKETLIKSAGGGGGGSSSKAPNPVVELAKLRRTAKGDEKIPVDKRVYVHVEAEAKSTSSKLPRGEFWYGKDWTVGRVLDKAAQGLQVANVNNRDEGEEKKLRVFHVEGGRMLEFGEKLGDAVVSGNTLVLLRGVKIVDLLVEE